MNLEAKKVGLSQFMLKLIATMIKQLLFFFYYNFR